MAVKTKRQQQMTGWAIVVVGVVLAIVAEEFDVWSRLGL